MLQQNSAKSRKGPASPRSFLLLFLIVPRMEVEAWAINKIGWPELISHWPMNFYQVLLGEV